MTFAVKKLDMKNSVNEYEIRNSFTHGEGFQDEKLGRGDFFKIFEE